MKKKSKTFVVFDMLEVGVVDAVYNAVYRQVDASVCSDENYSTVLEVVFGIKRNMDRCMEGIKRTGFNGLRIRDKGKVNRDAVLRGLRG